MKNVDSVWFTSPSGHVGIVTGEDEFTRKRKAYIGVGHGHNQDVDTFHLLEWGAPLPLEALEGLVAYLKEGTREFFGMKYPFKECARKKYRELGYHCRDCSVERFCEAPDKERD